MEPRETGAAKRWLQFYDVAVPPSLDYPEVPLDRPLAESAAKHPDCPLPPSTHAAASIKKRDCHPVQLVVQWLPTQ